MKKLLIPILSLLFIISLDSCQKDAVQQTEEEATRLVKLRYNTSGSSITETSILEYDQSGRITAVKDSAVQTNYITISYVGDEATLTRIMPNSNESYTVLYKLNSNHLPVQRISAEVSNDMSSTPSHYSIQKDTLRYEYDAAGLLVKATGAGYDSTWLSYPSIHYWATRKVYTYNYTNNAGKLMSVKISALDQINTSQGGTPLDNAIQTDRIYSFEYNKNYPNKVDVINAWVMAELELLYTYEAPMIKYANLPDKWSYTEKQTYLATGDVNNTGDGSSAVELVYTPTGYISTATSVDGTDWNKYMFIYNK